MTYNYYNYMSKYAPTPEEEANEFLSRYEAVGGLGQRIYYRRKPVRYTDWIQSGGPIPFDQEVEQERMVEMHLPQEQFRRLVERERHMQYLEQAAEKDRQVIQSMMDEEAIRRRSPSVQKAYEHYRTLLELCR